MEIPQSIQALINASAAFAMVCIALWVVYKRMTKAETENRLLLEEKADLRPLLQEYKVTIDEVRRIMDEVVKVEITREISLEEKFKKLQENFEKIRESIYRGDERTRK